MGNTVLEAAKLADKAQELTQMRNHEDNEGKVFLVIEGDDDEKIYSKFFDLSKVTFYVTGNCFIVLKLVEQLNSNSLFDNRIIGIKDADFDIITGKSHNDIPNLYMTDCHDVEMTILSETFESGLYSEYKICSSISLSNKVMQDLKNLSYFRLYNEIKIVDESLDGINFNDITYEEFYDGDNEIDMNICLNHIKSKCNNSRLPHFPTSELVVEFSQEYKDADILQLTRGHDFMHALSLRLKRITGKNDPLGYKQLCLALRFSCDKTIFEQTRLFNDLDNWMKNVNVNLWHS